MLRLGMPRPPCFRGLAAGADVRLELVPEFRDVGLDRPGSRIREDADGLSFHVAGDGEQVVQVLQTFLALRRCDA